MANILKHFGNSRFPKILEIKKSSDENIRVTREAYAALVVPSFGFDGNSGTMNVTFHNKGKSIVDVVASYEIEQISWPDAKQVYGSGVKGEIKDVRTPIDQAPSHYVFLPNFGDENFARYSKSTEVIRVKGTFRYSSASGDDVSKDFCFINRAFAQAYSCADSIRDFPRNALQK